MAGFPGNPAAAADGARLAEAMASTSEPVLFTRMTLVEVGDVDGNPALILRCESQEGPFMIRMFTTPEVARSFGDRLYVERGISVAFCKALP